jgi:phytanoyl-CoA hydroxylase
MLNVEQVERFHRDGFISGGQVLSEAEVEALQFETLRVIEDRDKTDKPQPVLCHLMNGTIWQIVNIWEASPAFRELIGNLTIVAEMSQLVGGRAIRLWHDQIQYKPATVGGVNHWHQDGPYWPILKPKTQVTAWVALDDVDEDNGCMRMVPGSHLWGNQIKFLEGLPNFDAMPASFEGHDLKVVKCPVKKGGVHFHDSLTWHGSGPNTSGRPRRAIALHYMTDQTHYDASGDHVMKRFVSVKDGEVLAGEHFPLVSKT